MRERALSEFGTMLADSKLEIWTDREGSLKTFKQRLAARLAAAHCDMHHYFACRIAEADTVATFSIGRVQFDRPDKWIEHVRSVAGRDLAWTSSAINHWQSGQPLETGNGVRHILAKTAVAAIGRCKWVAMVVVKGNDVGRSGERARFGVRLALDGLGLVMTNTQGRNLRGPGDDTDPRPSIRLSQLAGDDLLLGSSRDIPLLLTHEPQASTFMNDSAELRDAVGWVIEGVFTLPAQIELSQLRRRWCDAMYWFGERLH